MDSVTVTDMSRSYQVRTRDDSKKGHFFNKRTVTVQAVKNISFSIAPGEIVGFLGPNGAGKTTVLKCLTGIITPSSGHVQVLGHTPSLREKDYLRRITLVMGQKNQLLWDLPVDDSFLASQAMYAIPDREFRNTRAELIELLRLDAILGKPVRQLSLGERAKCEFAAALLHKPDMLFLDEPTLGLDVEAQENVLDFIRQYHRQSGCSVMLTSHYLGDITSLASRVIIIGDGRLAYEGTLQALEAEEAPQRVLKFSLAFDEDVLIPEATKVSKSGRQISAHLPRDLVSATASRVLANYDIREISVDEIPLEEILRRKISQAAAGSPSV